METTPNHHVTPQAPLIGVMIETNRSFSRGLIQAIAKYANNIGAWQIVLHEHHREKSIPSWLQDWKGDGLITRIYNPELAEYLAAAPYPVVDIAGSARHHSIPTVQQDQISLAKTAIDFFLNSAFSNFAFCGYPGLPYSDEHQKAFCHELEKRGFSPSVYHAPASRVSSDLNQREEFSPEGSPELTDWVLSLPRRTAIFTCTDHRAIQLQMSIKNSGRSIPDDLSVLGLGDESVMCMLSNPELSSLRHDSTNMALTACQWLQSMILGQPLEAANPQLFTVTERASTDLIACDDPLLIKALRFIRSNSHQSINAQSVMEQTKRSRNTLEDRFRKYLGRTIAEEILRVRIERARILLGRTNLSVEQIAHASGFATAAHFARQFKKQTAYTPGSYRIAFSQTH